VAAGGLKARYALGENAGYMGYMAALFSILGTIHLTWMKEGRWGIIALTRVAKLLKYLLLEMSDCPLL
jgi:Na+-transporting NADH:ubiquinone oxidoreductase subunit NqrB